MGSYVPHHLGDWFGSEEFVSGTGSGHLAANLDVWTDGSLVRDDVAGVCCGGAGIFAATSGACWVRRSWGHLDLLPPGDDPEGERCGLYVSVPKAVQSVQRAELWGVILALQAARPVHLGVDNANVVATIIAGRELERPFHLLVDGDLLSLVQKLLLARCSDQRSR